MLKTLELRAPTPEDGMAVHRLIAQCPPLDPNSIYCNLLQCSHFSATSVAASHQGDLVGFVSGYLVPGRADTLFIWQVAVGESARGQGLASTMVQHLLSRPQCAEVAFIETTINPPNRASWALFERLARQLNAELESSTLFDRDRHFEGQHDTEMLVKIGPLRKD